MSRFDDLARRLSKLSPEAFGAVVAEADEQDRPALWRAWYRYRIHDFAEDIVRPLIERKTRWYPLVAFHRDVLETRERFGARSPGPTEQTLILGPRGVAKTTATKIRVLHSVLYGLEAGILALAKNDTEAVGWTSTIGNWLRAPTPRMRYIWPRIAVTGNEHHLTLSVMGHTTALHARGWGSGVRGINADTARPTMIVLDDIEVEENTRTEDARDKTQDALNGKVVNALPQEGGGIILWLATTVHSDAVAVRALHKREGVSGWDVHRYQAVIAWPDRMEAWDAVRAAYLDFDAHADKRARRAAARAVYEAHREECDRGARVLDEHRLPIFECFLRLWDMGPGPFGRELQNDPRAGGDSTFDSSTFCYHRVDRETCTVTTAGGKQIRYLDLPIAMHWDPSSGGKKTSDRGAIAVGVGQRNGRTLVLEIVSTQRRFTEQARLFVATAKKWGVRHAQVEGNQLPDAVEEAIRVECVRQDWHVTVDLVWTSENKQQRLAGLQPATTNGQVSFPVDMPQAMRQRFDDFDERREDNADDEIDAVQRLHEALHSGQLVGVVKGQRGTA